MLFFYFTLACLSLLLRLREDMNNLRYLSPKSPFSERGLAIASLKTLSVVFLLYVGMSFALHAFKQFIELWEGLGHAGLVVYRDRAGGAE